MPFVYNVPFFSIFLAMIVGICLTLVKNGRLALRLTMGVAGAIFLLSAWLFAELARTNTSYIYLMGHYPAPWGNELQVGPFEAGMAAAFCLMLLAALPGGRRDFLRDIPQGKQSLFCLFINLALASSLVLIYTNDLFTGYVFVEIMAIVAAGLVMAEGRGRSIAAAMRYVSLSAVGSGLFLMGITITYYITGHLLMNDLGQAIRALFESGEYRVQLVAGMGLMVIGLSIKSALFPFHGWLPEAYSACTTMASAVQSGLISKCYLFLIIKFICRMCSLEILLELHITDTLFVLGLAGMIYGSLKAMGEEESRRMIAYSSVAQVAYIFMGIGLGTLHGLAAACYQLLAHTFTKPMLFTTVSALVRVGEGSDSWHDLRGSALRAPLAGVAFSIGGLSLCGLPLLAGFAAKFELAAAAVDQGDKMLFTLLALGASSVLNSMYYIPAMITIWTPPADGQARPRPAVPAARDWSFVCSTLLFLACNLALGILIGPVMGQLLAGIVRV